MADADPARRPGPNEIDDQTEEFVGVVLAETEEVWGDMFAASGLTYEDPTLVLFTGQTVSACGGADAAMGPFYCPGDRNVYLDTDFFRVMGADGRAGRFRRGLCHRP